MSDTSTTKVIGFNIDIDLANAFRGKCASRGEKYQDVVTRLIEQFVNQDSSQEKAAS